jgi:hypothetical protein
MMVGRTVTVTAESQFELESAVGQPPTRSHGRRRGPGRGSDSQAGAAAAPPGRVGRARALTYTVGPSPAVLTVRADSESDGDDHWAHWQCVAGVTPASLSPRGGPPRELAAGSPPTRSA